ncbi:MAG: hypothetical protein LBT04_01595 [Prevotellaceae bacterium]|jgi:hypothetical protein|nr:hypothetical protein [Prevotellaceae bacterium]
MKTNSPNNISKIDRSVFSLQDLKREKAALLKLRKEKRQYFISYREKIATSLSIATFIAKPVIRQIFWIPIAFSVGKTVFAFIKDSFSSHKE